MLIDSQQFGRMPKRLFDLAHKARLPWLQIRPSLGHGWFNDVHPRRRRGEEGMMQGRLKWVGTAALALGLIGAPQAFAFGGGGFHGGGGGFHGGGGGFHGGGGGWHGGGWHGGWYGGYGGWGYGGWGYPYWGYGWASPYLYGVPYSYGYAYSPPPEPEGGLFCVTRAHMCGLDAAKPPGSRCVCSGGRGRVTVLQGQ
jgi:hypothetical protein